MTARNSTSDRPRPLWLCSAFRPTSLVLREVTEQVHRGPRARLVSLQGTCLLLGLRAAWSRQALALLATLGVWSPQVTF